MAAIDEATVGDLHERLTEAFTKFRMDLGFTAPEMIGMRVDDLEARLHFMIEKVADPEVFEED